MRLLEWFRQRDLKKIQATEDWTYLGFAASKKYLLFYQYSQLKQAEVLAWQQLLEKEGKEVECMAFFEGKLKDLPKDIAEQNFTRSDLSWWGRPKSSVFKGILKRKYDVFIDLSSGDHIAAKYVRYGSNASLKVNFGHQKKPWSDLQLDFILREQGPQARSALVKLLAFINK